MTVAQFIKNIQMMCEGEDLDKVLVINYETGDAPALVMVTNFYGEGSKVLEIE